VDARGAEPALAPTGQNGLDLKPFPLAARPAYALAAASGVVYFLGFPGVDLWPLSFVALVPLLVAVRGQTPKRAAGLGLVHGMFISFTGFYWLFGMLQRFSGFPAPICVMFMLALCAYQGGRTALLGLLHARAEVRGWPSAPAFALAFVASELVYPLLFPWYFGASVHNAPALLQAADLGGPYLVGLILVAPNLALAEVVFARLERRPIARRLVAAGLAIPAIAAVYGAVRLRQIGAAMATAEPITIGIVQPNEPLKGAVDVLATHLRMTTFLREQGADLVLWSEGADLHSYPEEHYEELAKKEITHRLGVPAIIGTGISRKTETLRRTHFNTALLSDAEGTILGRYDKQVLLAFGEYLPLGTTFPILYRWSPSSGRYSPGTSLDPLIFGAHRLSVIICYEDILPAFVNRMVRHADPDLIINLTNDTWFGDTTEPREHLALAQLRAVEHRRYLIRATNSGLSAIIDATGRIVMRGGQYREEALIGEARYLRRRTGYEVVGDAPWYACALAVALMALVNRERIRRGSAPAS
jgi:apolipoprotein N-acyltransferase